MKKPLIAMLLLATVSLGSTVSVVGYSSLKVLPDAATIYFDARIRSEQASDIYQEANRLLADLTRKLRKAGIKKSLTEEFQPDFNTGYSYYDSSYSYTYSIRLSIYLDDLSLMDEFLETLTVTYPEGVYIAPTLINYALKDPAPYLAELRKRALENAHLQAEQLAKLQGKTVGELVYVKENERHSISIGARNYNIYYGLWGYEAEDTGGRSLLPRLLAEYKISATYQLVD